MEPLILIGGGGHCCSCIDVLRLENKFEIVGILDIPEKIGSYLSDIKIIASDIDIPLLAEKYRNFLITIGQIKTVENRMSVYYTVKKSGGLFPVIISPRAYVSQSASIGEGSIIMHNSVVNAYTNIGKNCIINTGSLIEHEVNVGDFCHISTQAVLNGQVNIGDKSFIGSNAVIANNLSLPEGIIVAAGACLLKSPVTSGIYIGNPARRSMHK